MISIEGYSEYGFMVNGVQFRGGLFAFPGFALMWDAHEFEDLTWESLALIRTLQTPPGAWSSGRRTLGRATSTRFFQSFSSSERVQARACYQQTCSADSESSVSHSSSCRRCASSLGRRSIRRA